MEKIKQFFNKTIQSEKGKDILIVIIVILVGLGSFELGRLSKEKISSGIKILPAMTEKYPNQENQDANKKTSQATNVISTTNNIPRAVFDTSVNDKNFFASNRGSKYYTLGCSAGKTIKQENRIYFMTGEEAQIAGYALSSSCN